MCNQPSLEATGLALWSVTKLEYFSNVMGTVKNSFNKLDKILDVMPSSVLKDLYDELFTIILKLLEIHFNDINCWISYWVFDLDFGKKYKPGMVKIGKEEVSLKTIEDLYKVIS